jgi:hypothetical protein
MKIIKIIEKNKKYFILCNIMYNITKIYGKNIKNI